jgi:tRNA G18 (ribose-2'-O)-methylase SpoU
VYDQQPRTKEAANMSDENERSVASYGSQPVMAIVSSDEAALRIIVRQQRSEIERLKDAIRRIADQDATLSACDGNVTVQVDATLTDEEREALRHAEEATAGMLHVYTDERPGFDISEKLRGLRERLG